MVKLALKIVLFSILFFIGLSFMDDHFKEKRISYFARETYKKMDANVAIAIFGSSHGINGIDPRLLQKETKKHTYNFSTAGQRLVSTIPVIDEILGDNDLELAIIDIFPGTVRSLRRAETKARAFQYNTFDNIDFSISKVIAHSRVNGIEAFPQISPTLRRHNKWVNIIRNREPLLDPHSDFNNGYFSRFFHDKRIWDRKIISIEKNREGAISIEALNEDEKGNIQDLLAKFEKKKVPVLFISTPYYQDTLGLRISSHQALIMDHLTKLNIPVIDFNALWDELQFVKEDFTDAGHVNTKGALKVSTYLAKYVKDNFSFTSESIDEKELFNNRYAIIDNDFQSVPFNVSIDSTSILYKKGIRKVYGFNAYEHKNEILFEVSDSLDPFTIKFEYTFDPNEANKIDRFMEKRINKKGVVEKRANVTNQVNYGGKAYSVFQFRSVFNSLKNFKLFYIDGKERIEIVKFDELILNDGNR